ncbi:class I SAM-dependent methyltransferase [Actinopolymorpha alba]|uniref:class I SAM-dependent methyltransferase n=1 Tax=Actinopolymorpha alba TaxID=533267 RepID=UPI000377D66E|nr:class I SAM-dependent methyltransferase [Actinopolymorpha alba]
MPEPEYSDDYTDPRLAIFYDQLNPWGPDRDFYLDLVMAADSVLDVGCGTGSVLRKARPAGHTGRLVGLDPAAAMLNQAKASTDVDWIHGDLGSVPFDQEFELVIMTGHVFQVFLTDNEIAAALTAVRAALADGGRFAFETLNPRLRPWERWTNQAEVVAADGTVVSTANTNPRLVERGIVEVVGRFSSPNWEREVLCPSRFRFVEVEELDAFLSEAGLAVVERYGLWDRRPFTEQLPEIITIATGV